MYEDELRQFIIEYCQKNNILNIPNLNITNDLGFANGRFIEQENNIIIHLRNDYRTVEDAYIACRHELRHLYQYTFFKKLYDWWTVFNPSLYEKYKLNLECNIEVDANLYGIFADNYNSNYLLESFGIIELRDIFFPIDKNTLKFDNNLQYIEQYRNQIINYLKRILTKDQINMLPYNYKCYLIN